MCYANNKMPKKANDRRNKTTISRKNQNAWKKRKLINSREYWKWMPSNKWS